MVPGFWSLLLAHWRHIFLHWYFVLSLVLGIAPAVLVTDSNLQERYTLILRTEATVSVGLLGVVLAGLSLIVTLMNDELLRVSNSIGRGVIEDFFPFSFTAVVAVLTSSASLMFLILTPQNDELTMRIGIGLSTFLFVWTLFNMLALVRLVARRGLIRALYASQKDSGGPGDKEVDGRR